MSRSARAAFGQVCSVRRTCARGFTLIEAVVSMVIVGVMLVAALQTVAAAADARRRGAALSRADDLARVLLSEVCSKAYEDPNGSPVFGTEAGEIARDSRNFNDFDDYHGFTQTDPTLADGTALAGYTGWSWGVSVKPQRVQLGAVENLTQWESGGDGSGDAARLIIVLVRSPDGVETTVETLRSRFAPLQAVADADNADLSNARVRLSIGEGAIEVIRGGELSNVPEAP